MSFNFVTHPIFWSRWS